MKSLYIYGPPGSIGGAATKIKDMLLLLRDDFNIYMVLPHKRSIKDKDIDAAVKESGVRVVIEKDLPKRVDGIALVICEIDIFSSGRAHRIKERGLRLYFSNEMMWTFKGEEEAVKNGLIDKVLFLSEFQAKAFRDLYKGIPEAIIDNYVDPSRFAFVERRNERIVLGRLSRSDPVKYPEDFPVFYESLEIPEARFMVMAWNDVLNKKYAWHSFGSSWKLLSAGAIPSDIFLQSLDMFVYSFGPFFKESWGRAVVEAMLTGAIPIVPNSCHFGNLIVHGETGYLCSNFGEYREAAQNLFMDYGLRKRMSKYCASYARDKLCNREHHRKLWRKVLNG